PRGDDLERACTRDRLIRRQLEEIAGLAGERLVEQAGVAPPRNLRRTKALQMLGDILRVEQLEAAMDQPRHQMHQRDLGRIARGVEHALAEERPPKAHPVEAADEFVALPGFDAVAMPELVQPAIEVADALVDPGVLASGLRRGAARDRRLERGIDGDAKRIR